MNDNLAATLELLNRYSGKEKPRKAIKTPSVTEGSYFAGPDRKKSKRDLNVKVKREISLKPDRKPLGTKVYDGLTDMARAVGVRGSDARNALDTFEFATGLGEITDAVDRGLTGDYNDDDISTLALNGVLGGAGGLLARPAKKVLGKVADTDFARWMLERKPLEEARPEYERVVDGNYLVVRRKDLVPETVPEAADAKSLGDLRVLINNFSSNPARRMVEDASQQARGVAFDPSLKPKTSMQRQAGIGRAYTEAVSGNPDYDRAIFERYGELMPEVVEKSGAQNYDQLREKAYLALSDEVRQQFDRLPLQTTYHGGDIEYPTPSAMMRDALAKGNLNVFQGGDPHEFLDAVDKQTGLTLNEMFRAVHDYAGHVAPGSTFRPGGEEIAYATHAQTMSPLAQMALLSETRGQNSLVNYSGLNADLIGQMEMARRQLREREIAQSFLESSTPSARRDAAEVLRGMPAADDIKAQLRELGSRWQYADQKAVLLPPEYLDPMSKGGTPDYLREVMRRPDAVSARGVHISTKPDLEATDPSFYGRGHQGEEYPLVRRSGGADRTYFYTGPEGTVVPEDAVMGSIGGEMRKGPRYAYEAQLEDLYDLQQDPEGLARLAKAYNLPDYEPQVPYWMMQSRNALDLEGRSPIPDLERLVKDYGYSGYLTDRGLPDQRAAALYDPVEQLRRIERGIKGYAEGGYVE